VAVEITVKISVKKGKQGPKFMGTDAGFHVRDKPASIGPGKIGKLVTLFLGMRFVEILAGCRNPFAEAIGKL
jgi:hypothetical protein